MRYHVVVTGSRPEKGADNKFLPMPKENVEFIHKVLDALPKDGYVALYHGMANGVDAVVDDYAFTKGIRVRQYPAYWFNPSKPNNFDKAAGFFRNDRMIRDAKQNVWQKDDEQVVVLGFHNKPLADSKGTAHAVETAKKIGLTVRTYALPVQVTTESPTQSSTDEIPFSQPAN